MNDKDKEAFEKWFLSLDGSHLNRVIKLNRGASYEAWQAACNYKDKEILEWREAARSEANEVNILQAENKKLCEALLECPIVGEIHRDSNERFKEWNLIHRNTIREALKEVNSSQ